MGLQDSGGGWNRGIGKQDHGQGWCSRSKCWMRRISKSRQGRRFRGTRDLREAGEQGPTETSSREIEKPRN